MAYVVSLENKAYLAVGFFYWGWRCLKIILNGKQEVLKEGTTVAELIVLKGLNPDTIVVEYNHELVKKENLAGTFLKENDRLEILRFVGGG